MSGLDTCQADRLAAWAAGAKRRVRLSTARVAGGLRFAFYARVSTTGYQDSASSRRWQLDVATELIAGKGRIVAEFIDVGYTRELSWTDRPQAAALLAAARDPDRGPTARSTSATLVTGRC